MTSSASPPMLRRRVGLQLRRLREERSRQLGDVAAQLGWSESKLSRIETGQTGIRPADLGRLLTIYEVSDVEHAQLLALTNQARQRGWWEAYGDALPDAYEAYIGFEAEASAIYTYEAQVVPGLLQTAEYAHAVMQADGIFDDREVANQRIAVRMARQAVLTRDPPAHLRVILDEAVLRRPIGGHDVQRRQLLRLVEASERSVTTIQVLPFSVGGHGGLAGSFIVLEFPNESDDSLVYAEGVTGGVFRSRPSEVRAYHRRFAALSAAALDPEASVRFIAAAAHAEG